jgi:hypothetical protein
MEQRDIVSVDFLPDTFISRDGRLWRNGKEKKFTVAVNGYEVVSFSFNNKTKTFTKHRLLLHAFVSPCPEKCEALHINGNKLDNRLENLRWGTRKENVADAIKHGTATIGIKNGRAKLTPKAIKTIRQSGLINDSIDKLSSQFQVSVITIRRVLNGLTYKGV